MPCVKREAMASLHMLPVADLLIPSLVIWLTVVPVPLTLQQNLQITGSKREAEEKGREKFRNIRDTWYHSNRRAGNYGIQSVPKKVFSK